MCFTQDFTVFGGAFQKPCRRYAGNGSRHESLRLIIGLNDSGGIRRSSSLGGYADIFFIEMAQCKDYHKFRQLWDLVQGSCLFSGNDLGYIMVEGSYMFNRTNVKTVTNEEVTSRR
jgi:hypothetical protein